jgi:hypothetical protein
MTTWLRELMFTKCFELLGKKEWCFCWHCIVFVVAHEFLRPLFLQPPSLPQLHTGLESPAGKCFVFPPAALALQHR